MHLVAEVGVCGVDMVRSCAFTGGTRFLSSGLLANSASGGELSSPASLSVIRLIDSWPDASV